MCGFAGIIYKSSFPSVNQMASILDNMGEQIAHRGPDDNQTTIDGQVGLVFRRLSIMDLENGRQPMTNEDESIILMVNGEIYNHLNLRLLLKGNHVFKSKSDCEIILHLYEEIGENFLKYLNGMFSLVLWDKKMQKVLIARDRLGIKPLYYNFNNNRIIFGSEIKALFAFPDCPRSIDWYSALSYSHGKPISECSLPTFFEGIHSLKGGEYITLDIRNVQIDIKAYWVLTQPTYEMYNDDGRTAKQIIEGYNSILSESIKMQMMSDVGIGLFLSGGIDSVCIARIASDFIKLPTFTVFSQSTFQNGDVQSASYAAKCFGLENHQVYFDWNDNFYDGDYWKRLLWHLETPLCSAEQLYKYELHRYVKNTFPNLKCILLGQGSDEFNGGYSEMYINSNNFGKIKSNKGWPMFMNKIKNMRNSYYTHGYGYESNLYDGLLNADYMRYNKEKKDQTKVISYKKDDLWCYLADVHMHTLQTYNLWHEDRTSSAHGIESRVPFLDHRLVEYTMSVPPKFRKELFWNKEILRKGFKGSIPNDLLLRPKIPFFHGEEVRYTYKMLYNMLLKDNRKLIYEALGEPDTKHNIIDRLNVQKYINLLETDVELSGLQALLTLVNLGLMENMISSSNFQKPICVNTILADRIIISDFDSQKVALTLQLATRRHDVTLNTIFKPSNNVKIVVSEDNAVYIEVDGFIEYSLEEEYYKVWGNVIQHFDGEKSLGAILNSLNVGEHTIRLNLEEALDYKILELVSDNSFTQ